jgi:hypothetical protein
MIEDMLLRRELFEPVLWSMSKSFVVDAILVVDYQIEDNQARARARERLYEQILTDTVDRTKKQC